MNAGRLRLSYKNCLATQALVVEEIVVAKQADPMEFTVNLVYVG
jgi:hypothetical protein